MYLVSATKKETINCRKQKIFDFGQKVLCIWPPNKKRDANLMQKKIFVFGQRRICNIYNSQKYICNLLTRIFT